jgi:hypothetical protein
LIIPALVLTVAGCQKSAVKTDLVSPVTPGAPADPHAGVKAIVVPAGIGHKGVVVDSIEAGEYSYIQIEEGGKKLWVAVMSTKVKKGDQIEFADSPPFTNFQSKKLNKTFDTVIFADGIRNNGPAK